jgi:hypothetical protein
MNVSISKDYDDTHTHTHTYIYIHTSIAPHLKLMSAYESKPSLK